MRLTLQPADELQALLARSTDAFAQDLAALGRAAVEGKPLAVPREDVYRTIWHTQALADLIARKRVRLYARNVEGRASFADRAASPIMPRVPFEEAVADLVSREPMLAASVDEVAQVYAQHGFTLARAAEEETVKQVQKFLAKSLHAGTGRDRTTEILEGVGDWGRTYSTTVYANAVTSAYTAGVFREMRDPDIVAAVPALQHQSAGDIDVRPNHKAADILVAAPDDPVWDVCAPPHGHRCRCGVRFVDASEVSARGLMTASGRVRRASVPPGFHRDAEFVGGRPDRSIYGG